MPTADCLYSTVINVSGSKMFFPFLPEHGLSLEDGAEATFLGDPVTACQQGHRSLADRNFAGLTYALENGLLEIIKTPAPILYDETDDISKMLVLGDGALYAVDPCWAETAYSSPL